MAPPAERLSLAELDERVDEAAERSHAKNTKGTYATAARSWREFCAYHELTPFPATTRDLGRWAADLASQGRKPNTLKTYASAIRSLHRRPDLAGLPIPAEPWPVPELTAVDKVLLDLGKKLAKANWTPKQAEAMLLVDLRRIKAHMAPEGFFPRAIDVRDWAILTLGFAMGGRRSELSCLDISHIAIDPDNPEWMMVRLCTSKTDQEGAGEVVMIKRAADSTVCAVRAVFDWLVVLRMLGATTGPLFRQLSSGGDKLMTNGMATTPEGLEGRLSGKAICLRYSKRSLDAQIPGEKDPLTGFAKRLKRFTGHSGRRGGPTEASRRGATHEQLCAHFRWVKGSKMAYHYVEQADKRKNNPMAAVM